MNPITLSRRLARCLVLVVTVSVASVAPAEQPPDLHKQLKDLSPAKRAKAALALAEANDAEAIPVLIDLLTDLPAAERQPIEEYLTHLAGEWAPVARMGSDDTIARKILRDAWKVWWRNTDGEALLGVVREHTLTPQMQQNVQQLIRKLGDDEFLRREAAFKELFRLGRITLPQLRETVSNKDLEIGRRVRDLIERIEREPARVLPGAAVRLLVLRKPAGAAKALLDYFPLAEEDNRTDEVQTALAALARRDGKLNAALVHGLADALPQRRAVTVEALVRGGGRQGRAAVRKLLADDAASVRLRTALALAQVGDKEGVPVLIDLLAVLPVEQAGQAEEKLYQLAGDSAPETRLGTEEAEKKKCRDAWAAWWKINAGRVDLARMSERALLGYTLICDNSANRVYEIDRRGKQRWTIDNIPNPLDAVVLPGNRVLIAENSANRVTERDFKGNILWQKMVASPVNVQRLPNGHTFIASYNGGIVEVDRNGKEIYSIPNVSGKVLAAYRSRRGDIVCLTMDGRCLMLGTTGKLLKELASGYKRIAGSAGNLDMRPNGRLLIARTGDGNQVSELDRDGKIVREWKATNALTASSLPNGHLLFAGGSTRGVYELDRVGKIVWQYRGQGKGSQIFRARRR